MLIKLVQLIEYMARAVLDVAMAETGVNAN